MGEAEVAQWEAQTASCAVFRHAVFGHAFSLRRRVCHTGADLNLHDDRR